MQIDDLPVELLLHILSFLSLDELLPVQYVCSLWRSAFKICLSRVEELRSSWPEKTYTNESLQKLLPHVPSLRTINIDNKIRYSDSALLDLDPVSNHCRQLVEINLQSFRVTVPALHRLCLFCPCLQVVTMNFHCRASWLEVLLSHQPHLRRLILIQPSLDRSFTGNMFECLSQLPVSLECLHIINWERYHFEGADVLALVSRCKRLRVLQLERVSRLKAAALHDILACCRRLERLSLRGSPVLEESSLRPLVAGANLRQLDLSDLGWVRPLQLAAGLAGCVQLEELVIAGLYNHPLEQCLPAAGLPSLRRLSAPRSLAPSITDSTLLRLRSLTPRLRLLDVSFCRSLTEPGLRQLGRLTELRHLMVVGVPAVSDSLLDCLMSWRLFGLALGHADSFNGRVSVAAVTQLLLRCSQLRRLTLLDRLRRARAVAEGLTRRLDVTREVTMVLYPGFPQRLAALATDQLQFIDTAAARATTGTTGRP